MLKNLLIECTELLNRNDLTEEIKRCSTVDEIKEQSIQNDVLRLISFYNFLVSSIFDGYIELTTNELVTSDKSGNIYFSKLMYRPKKILKLESLNKPISYMMYPNIICCNLSNTTLNLTYNYIPPELKDLSDKLCTEDKFLLNTISYGLVSEFLASKSLFCESDFWKNKFLYNLFFLKNKKGKYIKPTFILWK